MIARYTQVASTIALPQIQFGVGGITFFPNNELDKEQIGYEGVDWKESWLVIAREDTCGDPIFVDVSDRELPVFTAWHGEGVWDPQPVAATLSKFSEALVFLKPFCANREHPVGLTAHPLSSAERATLTDGLRRILGKPVPSFWQVLFEAAP